MALRQVQLTGMAPEGRNQNTVHSIYHEHCVRNLICVPPQGHCVAALMALLELMSPRHYQMIRQTFAKASDLEVSTH